MASFSQLLRNSLHEQNYQLAPFTDPSYSREQLPQNQKFFLEYVHFPLQLTLVETREKEAVVRQQIHDGILSFILDFQSVQNRSIINSIKVFVAYTNNTNNNKTALEVPMLEISLIQETKTLVKANLNLAQSHPGNQAFFLSKNTQELFHLDVLIHLNDGRIVEQRTRSFTLVWRVEHRSINEIPQFSNCSDVGSTGQPLVANQNSLHSSSTSANENFDKELVRARTVVAEHIQARAVDICGNNLLIGKTIQSANGDIAYHFTLQNNEDVFEEGEVVGFFNPEDGGYHKVCKLSLELSSHALLKGVVSRSQYLEVHKPTPGTHTETVAMLGIVPVQVVGDVFANEALYASSTHPGCAVSGSALSAASLNETAFIGYAFTARKTDNEQSRGMVQAAVSILQSAALKLHANKVRRLEETVDEKIVQIRRFGKRTRRCICIGTFTLILFSSLAGILAWQLMEPGSALRYKQCEMDRKIPYGRVTYSFVSYKKPYHHTWYVNGIEFDFPTLMKKASHNYQRLKLNDTTILRYYLNIDRCAHGRLQDLDVVRGIKAVKGPTVFAVDEKCFHAYYYSERKSRWRKYNSVSWKKKKNICCEPQSRWKNCTELNESRLCNNFGRGIVQNCF